MTPTPIAFSHVPAESREGLNTIHTETGAGDATGTWTPAETLSGAGSLILREMEVVTKKMDELKAKGECLSLPAHPSGL